MKEFLAVAAIIAFFVVVDKVRSLVERIQKFTGHEQEPKTPVEMDPPDRPEAPRPFERHSAETPHSHPRARRVGVQLPRESTYSRPTAAAPQSGSSYGPQFGRSGTAEMMQPDMPAPQGAQAAQPAAGGWSVAPGAEAVEKAVRRRSRKQRRRQENESTYKRQERAAQQDAARLLGSGGGLATGVGGVSAAAVPSAAAMGVRPTTTSVAADAGPSGWRRRSAPGSQAGSGRRRGSELLRQADLRALILGHEVIEPRWKTPYR